MVLADEVGQVFLDEIADTFIFGDFFFSESPCSGDLFDFLFHVAGLAGISTITLSRYWTRGSSGEISRIFLMTSFRAASGLPPKPSMSCPL